MIKFLLSAVLLIPILVNAETNNNWLPWVGGTLDKVCRETWRLYDQKYDTSTNIIIKQGAAGELASKEMIESNKENLSVCAGSTMILYNHYLFKNKKTYTKNIDMIVRIGGFATIWYGPTSIPDVKNFREYIVYLKNLNRPINVGAFIGPHRTIIKHLISEYNIPVNTVMFKNGTQMYSSLYKGDIDLGFDTGGAFEVAKTGKFKIIGYHGQGQYSRLVDYIDFTKDDPELAKIESWFGIAVPANISKERKNLLVKRFESIIQQDSFKQFADNAFISASGETGLLLKKIISQQEIMLIKHWN